jgi:hypothetical protein
MKEGRERKKIKEEINDIITLFMFKYDCKK